MRKVGSATPAKPGQPTTRSKWISTLCRFGLAGIWLWAGMAKAADPLAAENAVRAYQLAPEALIKPIAWGLPFIEIGLAALFVFGIAQGTAATISLGLFGMFIAAIVSAWARGIQIACGCFGGGGTDPSVTWIHYVLEIVRDTGFIAMAAWLMARPHGFQMFGRR